MESSEVVPKLTRTLTDSWLNGPLEPKTLWSTRTQTFDNDFTSQLVPTVNI